MSWHDNVKVAIGAQCLAAYRQENPKRGSRHRPYQVPDLAAAMVKALNADDEHEGKRLLLIYRTGALSLV